MKKKIELKYLFISTLVITFIVIIVITVGCGKNYSPEEKEYIIKIEQHRAEYNNYMKNNSNSPFNFKGKVEFHDLNYFDIDPDFVFKSKLTEYNTKDTITVFGTKGEERKSVKFGYLIFSKNNKEIKLNVYQSASKKGMIYYSIWFTDETTNKESYGVGRYIDFEKVDDPNYIYEVDFNKAYNPYCAYSPDYSCAIPTKEDFIPLAIKAGEKKFHD